MSCTKSHPILSCFKSADGLTTIPVFMYVLQGSNGESLGQAYSLTDNTQTLIDITTYNGGGKVTIGECPKSVIYEKEICGLIRGLTYELTKVYTRDAFGVMTLLHYEDSKGIIVTNVEEVCCDCNAICGPVPDFLPVANNDTSNITNVTQPTTVNVLVNDTTGDTIIPSTVILSTIGIVGAVLSPDGKTLVVSNQGTWTVNLDGSVTFTPQAGFVGSPTPVIYQGADAEGNVDTATVTLIAPTNPPVANNDIISGLSAGAVANISILGNDLTSSGATATTSNTFVSLTTAGLPAGSILNANGTVTVPGQGTWSYTNGVLSFTPQAGFLGDPTALTYTLTDNTTGLTDAATATADYNQAPVVVSTGIMRWEHNDNGGTSYAGTENVNCASSLTNISFGSGLTLLDNNGQPTTIPNGSTYEHILTGVAETTFAAAKTANDYVQVGFNVTGNSQISNVFHGLIPRAWGGTGAGGYQVTAEISNDNFATFSTLYSNATLPIPTVGYVANSQAVIYPMTTGSYTVRFYLYNEQNNATLNNGGALPNNTVAFDDLQITVDCLQ